MMKYQTTFKRYEFKYLLTYQQHQSLLQVMSEHMQEDRYGHCSIRNIYLDTADFRLIRNSLDKPVYKEKIRIRCYKAINEDEPVFIELKKKYRSIVYKRRISMNNEELKKCLDRCVDLPDDSQIAREINYFRSYYHDLQPAVFISYERDAYCGKEDENLRITFDRDITYRDVDLGLDRPIYGKQLLKKDEVLMEVKTAYGMPLWLTGFLSANKIYKTSYSKYGQAYMEMQNKERIREDV